jgi:hypothetical protein
MKKIFGMRKHRDRDRELDKRYRDELDEYEDDYYEDDEYYEDEEYGDEDYRDEDYAEDEEDYRDDEDDYPEDKRRYSNDMRSVDGAEKRRGADVDMSEVETVHVSSSNEKAGAVNNREIVLSETEVIETEKVLQASIAADDFEDLDDEFDDSEGEEFSEEDKYPDDEREESDEDYRDEDDYPEEEDDYPEDEYDRDGDDRYEDEEGDYPEDEYDYPEEDDYDREEDDYEDMRRGKGRSARYDDEDDEDEYGVESRYGSRRDYEDDDYYRDARRGNHYDDRRDRGRRERYRDDDEESVGAKILAFIAKTTAVERIAAVFALLILAGGIAVAAFYASAMNGNKQLESFNEIGTGLADTEIIGQSGLIAVADAEKARSMAAQLVVEDETQEEEEPEVADDAENVTIKMTVTSIKSDIKVKFINSQTGKLVANLPLEIEVVGPDGNTVTYNDHDQDGIIYKKDITKGEYKVTPKPLPAGYENYKLETTSKSVTVPADREQLQIV